MKISDNIAEGMLSLKIISLFLVKCSLSAAVKTDISRSADRSL